MTFKKNQGQWKMKYKNYTAYISRYYGAWSTSYYLSIDVDTFDGKYYEIKRIVSEREFHNLNKAKRYAKDYLI